MISLRGFICPGVPLLLCCLMAAPGAGASTSVAREHWSSLSAALHNDLDLQEYLLAGSPDSSSPGRLSFFSDTLAEFGPSVFQYQPARWGSFDLLALVLDSLSNEPLHRVCRGPGASFQCRRDRQSFSSAIARGWARVAEAVQLWDDSLPVDAASMGRAACKVEKIEEQLQAIAGCGAEALAFNAVDFSMAKDLDVTRLSLPSAPPGFDPSPYLDRPLRSLFLAPSDHAWPIESAVAPPPRVQFRCRTKAARLDFLAALDSSKRLRLFPADRFDHRTACGVFAIPKGLDADRLIIDARPSNLCVPTDVRWLATMGSAFSLLSIELEDHEQLLLTGEDIRDFYHQFVVTADRASQYRLVGFFKPSDLQHLSCFDPSLLQCEAVAAGLRCMAMGDCNAVSIAQASHIGLILSSDIVSWSQLLTLRGPIPRSPCMLGLVIDDVIILEKALRGDRFDPGSCRSRVVASALHRAYYQAGLPRHEKKGFLAATSASFWGADVLGELGVVRPAWSRLVPLVGITSAALDLPALTVSLLEVLAGAWVSVLSFRRRSLCLLEHVYTAQRGRNRSDLVRVHTALRAELFRLCVLAPLVRSDLRAQTSGMVVATDASDRLGAVVWAKVSKALSREMLRHVPVKGLWAKVLSPVNALLRQRGFLDPSLELPGEVYKTNPLWTQFARALQFRLLAVFSRRVRDHINIKELDSCLAAEEALAPFSWESARSLSLVDSQVSLGSLLKGRSSSASLNSRLRSALPGLLFFNLHPYYAYLASADNPADDPTRDRPVRSPAISEPLWLKAAELGQFAELDRFLAQFGLDPLQLQGLDLLQKSFEERDRSPGVPSSPDPGLGVDAPAAFCASPALAAQARNLRSVPRTSALLQSVSRQQLFLSSTARPRAPATPSGPGYLCLYSGSRGVARAAVQVGFAWAVTFDWQHGPQQDLLNPSLQDKIVSAIESGDFAAVGLSPSCPSLCSAMRPAVPVLGFSGRPSSAASACCCKGVVRQWPRFVRRSCPKGPG